MDEGFYLTIPYRLIQGDCLLVDEWHVSQLAGFLLIPVLKLYLLVFRSTEGIYLAFRYIYLCFLGATTVVSYMILRKRDQKLAVLACMIFFMFTPNYVKLLNYNSIGLMGVWLSVVLMLTQTRFVRTKYVILGVLLAVVVLCNPYMALLYFLYTIICMTGNFSGLIPGRNIHPDGAEAGLYQERAGRGTIQEREELFGLKAWMFVTVGAGILLAIFLVFLLSRTTVAEITENFVYIFWDPAHEKKTISNFFESIIWFIDWFKWFFLVFGAGVLGAVFCPKLRKLMYIGLMLLSVLLWVLLVVFKSPGVGKHMIMLPLTMLGGTAFALTREKAWDIFIKGWMVGIVYAVCMNLSSNQGVYVMCNACTISSCVSLFLIRDFFEEHPEWRSRSWWFAALAAAQLLSEAGVNLRAVYGEDNISALTCQIEQGPQKGIWTTEEKKEDYNINYENIKSIGNLAGKTIMFFNYFPCGYLAANEAENGAFSAWVPEYKRLDSGRLPVYYEFHPDKVPDVIYIDTLAVLEWPEDEWDDWCRQNHYLREDFPRGGSVMLLQE